MTDDSDEAVLLRAQSRPSGLLSLTVPLDVMTTIEEIAAIRDMSPEALLRFYIGHGLREDVARMLPHPPAYLRRATTNGSSRRDTPASA